MLAGFDETVFRVEIDNLGNNEVVATIDTRIRIIHQATSCAIHVWPKGQLPAWGFEQKEVNGNKNIASKENIWIISSVAGKESASCSFLLMARRAVDSSYAIGRQERVVH